MRLGRLYFEATNDTTPFGAQWQAAVQAIVRTYREQQKPLTAANFTHVNYTFQTLTYEPKDTSAHGIGAYLRDLHERRKPFYFHARVHLCIHPTIHHTVSTPWPQVGHTAGPE